MNRFVLSFDPSGSWHEGKGTTGWCVFSTADSRITCAGNISANKFNCAEAYWCKHLELLENYHTKYKEKLVLVVEDYLLYESRAKSQINSRMETPKLIGIIQVWAYRHNVPLFLEPASVVKTRWSNNILNYKGYIKKSGKGYIIPGIKYTNVTRHCLDAVRHAVHVATFRLKELEND